MKLFVGLGNPEQRFVNTRHNIGFNMVDAIHEKYNFPAWREDYKGLVSKGKIGTEDVILLKPLTYMNNSGESIILVKNFFKLQNSDIVVFYDEMALQLGRIKIKRGGNHAGHNGIKSVDSNIGSGYLKVRMGIGTPQENMSIIGHVLGKFSMAEMISVNDLINFIVDNSEDIANMTGLDAIMSKNSIRLSNGDAQTNP